MYLVKNGTASDQVEHWICEATCNVMDNRTESTVEELKIYFEVYADYDETEGYIVKSCRIILKGLGYTFCGLKDWQLEKLNYDAQKMFGKLRKK